jgi:hypothetical protein
MARALAPFGWTCTDEFWRRYYSDPWVFNLANAVERLDAECDRHRRANLVRAVIEGWNEDVDGALVDYVNEHGWDAVPWKVAAVHAGIGDAS